MNSTHDPGRGRRLVAAVAILITAAIRIATLATGAASAGHRPNGPKPTIVVVHPDATTRLIIEAANAIS